MLNALNGCSFPYIADIYRLQHWMKKYPYNIHTLDIRVHLSTKNATAKITLLFAEIQIS